MKKQPRVALVCAGPLNSTRVGSLPALFEQLRWIKASTVSSATRAAHTLGCGTAVREYSDLSGAEIVLIKAPDAAIPQLVAEMSDAELDWTGRTAILFDSNRDSIALALLEKRGALPASLTRVPALTDIVMVEGHPEAVRQLRRVLRGRLPNLMEIQRGRKADYLAGVRLGTGAFLPMIANTIDHFRRAGMQKAAAEKTAASLFEGTVRAYFRAGKRLLQKPAILRA